MHLTGGARCKERRKKTCRGAAAQVVRRKRRCVDPAKASVMAYVRGLVRDGFARCTQADKGILELTLSSGEVFRLGKASIRRVI
jgi:hypothetical protein